MSVTNGGRRSGGSATNERNYLVRKRETSLAGLRSPKDGLKSLESARIDLGGVDGQDRSRLDTFDRDGGRVDLPAEGDGLRRIVDGGVGLLRRSSLAAVDQVDLVAVGVTVGVVTLERAVGKTETATILLTGHDARGDLCGAVALSELVRVGVSLNGSRELFSRGQGEVLDVVCVESGRLSSGGALRNRSQTVPSDTGGVFASDGRVENAAVGTGLVVTLAGLVPNDACHDFLLEIHVEDVMVEVVYHVRPSKSCSPLRG